MDASRRKNLLSGARIAVQQPSLLLWYLRSRLRSQLLPLERALLAGDSRMPGFVTLKPTLRCNLRCEFCRFVANGDVFGKRDWLELDDWKRVVDEISPFRPYICLTGGEPLMVPYLPELIAHIKRRGLRCVLTTNGTMLAARAAALMECPPDVVILSLDGPREVHDQVRGRQGTYDRALAGARKLAALRKAGGGPFLVLNTAITGHTFATARRMVEVAREFGAFALNFQHFWFLTRPMVEAHNRSWGDCFPLDFEHAGGTSTADVDVDELYETVTALRKAPLGLPLVFYPELDREQMRVYYEEPERFTHTHVPSCAWLSTDILPNGDVSPCFDLVTGNVLRQSFRDAWSSPAFRDHRQRLTEHGPYPVCARCCAYFRHD